MSAGVRAKLVADVEQAQAQLDRLRRDHDGMVEASRSSNADDEHDPEGATIAFEREQLTAMMTRVRRTIDDLQRALADLDEGHYGRCERCGGPIGADRLEVRPQARRCITCERAASSGR